jgi:TPR repeat protein
VKWYRLAEDQGDSDSQYQLGWCYYNGDGAVQDYGEAMKWLRLAAEQGHADAQYWLGNCYIKIQGEDVGKDWGESYFWFLLAAANGSEKGRELRDLTEEILTSQRREEIQTRARKWFEEHQ